MLAIVYSITGKVKTYLRILISSLITMAIGCSTNSIDDLSEENDPIVERQSFTFVKDRTVAKKIFVFLDGTQNEIGTGTNVEKLYNYIRNQKDNTTIGIYVSGVGTGSWGKYSGAALGTGMQRRILEGYEYISENYNPGDEIFIFGFSRGAHQARALAGFISYAGLLDRKDVVATNGLPNSLKLINFVQNKFDDNYLDDWRDIEKTGKPLLYKEIRDEYGFNTVLADVEFLGVWDTVPGSSFKKYLECKEKVGFFKRWFFWIPGVDRGHRYKTDSYPMIKNIAHAVSRDEKRSKFRPILICKTENSTPVIHETWFPGAHSDVGGGYADSNALSNISLLWMIEKLNPFYSIADLPKLKADPYGRAHWSMADRFSATIGKCEDRKIPEERHFHSSVTQRESKDSLPVWVPDKNRETGYTEIYKKYPLSCSDMDKYNAGLIN